MNGIDPSFRDEESEDGNNNGLIRTCHLCGKAQCGQRRGRVRCAYCKRVFCLQQLYKKFKIKAVPNDPHFKCPRCLGICCCVCDCQKPPPHVHCKVYKVRQNKRRNRELAARESASAFTSQMNIIQPIAIQPQNVQPVPPLQALPHLQSAALPQALPQLKMEGDVSIPNQYYVNEAPAPISQPLPESYPISYPDPSISNSFFYNTDIPGSRTLLSR